MPTESQNQQTIEVFFSYAHEDEELRNRLAKHLSILERQGVISTWHDRQIGAGKEWAGEINSHLDRAQIILLLVSADFLASDYCYDIEMTRALECHEAKEARVIPIILKPVDWQGAPFGKLQALPKNGRPVSNWSDVENAFLDVARGIRLITEEFTGQKEETVKFISKTAATSSNLLTAPLESAITLTKKFGFYFVAIAGTLTALLTLWDKIGLWQAYGALGIAAFIAVITMPLAIAVLTDTLPRWRTQQREKRLAADAKTGQPVRPGYFRLEPYSEYDHENFTRPDHAHRSVRDWLIRSDLPLLYLTGRSGTGKSSLLNAWVLPELKLLDPPYRTLRVRSFGDPLSALKVALTRPGQIWDKRPPEESDPRLLLEKACRRLQPARLLIVIDQFEEFIILHNQAGRERLESLLASLTNEPIPGLTVLLVLRSDYIGPLQALALPPLRERGNWFEIGPFNRADARLFFENSGLNFTSRLIKEVLDEAGEIEENPGLIRPITLNMLGMVIGRFGGGQPKGTAPDVLIRNYLREAVSDPEIAAHAP